MALAIASTLPQAPAGIGRCESCRHNDRALFPVAREGVIFDVCADCQPG